MKQILTTLQDFKDLPLKTRIYLPTSGTLMQWWYAGINPMSDQSIMLINGGNVQKMEGVYIGDKEVCYYTDYATAKIAYLDKAKERVKSIEKIYFES